MNAVFSGNWLAKLGSGKVAKVLSGVVGITTLLAIGGFVYLEILDRYDKEYLALAGEQQVLNQKIARYALASASGKENAFQNLRENRDRFERNLSLLENGNLDLALPPVPDAVRGDVERIREQWNSLSANADRILRARDPILVARKIMHSITALTPQLHDFSNQIVQTLVKQKINRNQIVLATRQLMLSQRIENSVTKILTSGEDPVKAAGVFANDAFLFGRVLQGMLAGDAELGLKTINAPEAQEKLQEVALLFSAVSAHAGQIIDIAPDVLPAQLAAGDITSIGNDISRATAHFLQRIDQGLAHPTIRGISLQPWMVSVVGTLAGIMLILLVAGLLVDARKREKESERQKSHNQEAILRLLDEMGDLADGDLSVRVTVTEDITGAIADSINYAIEALRSVVSKINNTSTQVSSSAQGTRAAAMYLAEASEHQTDQIRNASGAVNAIANSAEQISKASAQSSEVAQKSVEIADQGAEIVRKTIDGMDTIREQIQETSKRIKRLGESSQEIGDIVELIGDIADQTNILSLNAAVQAAMAGEAGRGFAVVADEVQRLAERAGNATKQIEVLVKTIQADTHEAVISMEQSTAGVVSGAKLAEDAGEALQKIDNVSKHIAELIQGISASALAQAGEAANISDTMNVIQEITTQTTEGTHQTADSVGNFAELADDLQKSVAGFRIPE